MSEIEAVLFDFDGVLSDSRRAKWEATMHALAEHGFPGIPREVVAPHMHMLGAVHRNLVPELDYTDLLKSYDQRLAELEHTIDAYADAESTLQLLRDRGIKIGVFSSSRTVEATLEAEGLLHLVDAIVGAQDIPNRDEFKPHPRPVLLLLERLGVIADKAVVVGDLPADILAGKAASVHTTVGVLHGFGTEAMLRKVDPDYIIPALQQLPTVLPTSKSTP